LGVLKSLRRLWGFAPRGLRGGPSGLLVAIEPNAIGKTKNARF
jgi:hypothetical protein